MWRTNLSMVISIKLRLVAGKTKVAQFYCPIVIDQYVLTFEITVKQLPRMQIKKSYCHLLCNLGDTRIIENNLFLVKHVKQTAFADKFSDHIKMWLLFEIYANAHIKDNVWMSQLIQHFDLLDEILQSFSSHVSLAKFLHSYLGSHPSCLEDVTISTAA